jgi:hypothetical protein
MTLSLGIVNCLWLDYLARAKIKNSNAHCSISLTVNDQNPTGRPANSATASPLRPVNRCHDRLGDKGIA